MAASAPPLRNLTLALTSHLFHASDEVLLRRMKVRLRRRHRLVASELHRGHDVACLSADLVDGRVAKFVHRECGIPARSRFTTSTVRDDVLVVPDEEFRTVCRRHNPRGD